MFSLSYYPRFWLLLIPFQASAAPQTWAPVTIGTVTTVPAGGLFPTGRLVVFQKVTQNQPK
jgi:hypothetical protein